MTISIYRACGQVHKSNKSIRLSDTTVDLLGEMCARLGLLHDRRVYSDEAIDKALRLLNRSVARELESGGFTPDQVRACRPRTGDRLISSPANDSDSGNVEQPRRNY